MGSVRCISWTILLIQILFFPGVSAAGEFDGSPVAGMVTMIDLGADFCPPCRQMKPILEKIARNYIGKAAIVLVDIGRHPESVKRYNVSRIPTQIFFDREGREVFRHAGFMDENAIVERLEKMGVR